MRARIRRLLLAGTVAGIALVPLRADSNSYIVRPDETLTGNRTEVGMQRVLAGTLQGNLKFGGLDLAIPGTVKGDLEFGGLELSIPGKVTGNARISGLEAEIAGSIGRDLRATVAEFTLHAGARIGRNAEIKAGQVTLLGDVDGDLQATGGTIRLGGTVKGNASLEAEEIVLDDGARIEGNLSYSSRTPLDLAGRPVVGGAIQYGEREVAAAQREMAARAREMGDRVREAAERAREAMPGPPGAPAPPEPTEPAEPAEPPEPPDTITFQAEDPDGGPGGWIAFYVVSLLFGMGAVALFRRHLPNAVEAVRREPALTTGVGFMGLIVIPVVSAIAAILIITIPLVVVVLVLYALAAFCSQVPVGVWLGEWALGRTRWAGAGPYASLAVGLAGLHLLKSIPYLGTAVVFAVLFVGFGAILVAGHAWWRSRRSRTAPAAPAPAVP